MRETRLMISGFFLAVVLIAGYQAVGLALFAFQPLRPGSTDSTIVEVRKGQNPREISGMLYAVGAIRDPRSFHWVGRITGIWKKIKAGEYKVSPAQTPLEIFGTISSGISVSHPITVREGENMYEVAATLDARSLASKSRILELCRDPKFIATIWASLQLKPPAPPTLEGYLFPDTYFFNRTLSPEEILRQMSRRFVEAWGEKEEARAQELGFSRHQLITLASMIEKETGAPGERPMISSVFHNRLRKRMRLQSDPTTIYGIWETYGGNIRKTDLLTRNPYNTYAIPALPAGPIANPGKEAIQAALYPATSDFLFFVSHNDGTHEFTRTFEDHNRAVRKFQLDPAARKGKSWRDLQKKKD